MTDLELYIHIPFCVRKCLYCDFVSFPDMQDWADEYLDALKREIRSCAPDYADRKITSIYIGGGTPSILTCRQISMLADCLYENFNISDTHEKRKGLFLQKKVRPETEFTIECNPGTLDSEKLKTYRKLGINRLSIGLQSTDENDLRTLGRIHSFEDFERSFKQAREQGFDNINIDLMQSIPGQTLLSWKRVMAAACTYRPEHISAYSLIIEEGTEFERLYQEGKLQLPNEDEDRSIYHYTKEFLGKTGYKRYEISNYALEGFECRHNKGYWQRADYLGLGLNASSMVNNRRWKNSSILDRYLSCPEGVKEEYSELSRKEQMEEFVFLGLRMTEGISKNKFLDTFGQDFDMTFGDQIRKFTGLRLLEEDGDTVRFTDAGLDVSNQVLSQLLL